MRTWDSPAITPPAVREGDRVALVAPGSPAEPERLVAGAHLLSTWGWDVTGVEDASARLESPFAHLAGTDAHRAACLFAALTEPGIAAVVCVRGGTATGRTLAQFTEQQWAQVRAASPRWVVGSSDATALHQAIAARVGWASVFGPMPATATFLEDAPSRESVRALLSGGAMSLVGVTAISGPRVVAPLVGGTLTVIESMVGTPDSAGAEGCVVVLEDIDEAPRRLDRALTHLRRCGWLDGVAGFAVGGLTDCGRTAMEVVLERIDLGVPVVAEVPVGHGPRQLAVPLGVPVVLDPVAGSISWPPPADDGTTLLA